MTVRDYLDIVLRQQQAEWLAPYRFIVAGEECDTNDALARLADSTEDAIGRIESLKLGLLPPGMTAADDVCLAMLKEKFYAASEGEEPAVSADVTQPTPGTSATE